MVDEPGNNGGRFQTSLSKQSRNFSWKIENLELWPPDTKKRTPYFYPEPNLKFRAKLQTTRSKYDTCITLSFDFIDGYRIHINHIAVVTDRAGNVVHNFDPKSYMYEFPGGECELDPYFILKEYPVLIFKWTMEFVKFTNSSVVCEHTTPATSSMPVAVNLLNLSNSLKEMYIEAQNTDTILKVDNVDVPVHKCILSKRSPVFAKMFEDNKIEYDIPGLQLSVLQGFVGFLYSANLHCDDFQSVHDLYHSAVLYQVDDLKTTCVSVLLSKLDVANACQALILAHDHQDIDFKKSVMDFILSHFHEIVKTTSFKQFVKEQTNLAAEVMENHIVNDY